MDFRNLYDIGIEFEFVAENKNSSKLVTKLAANNLSNWQIVHDGSTETPGFNLNGVPLSLDHKHSSGLFFLAQLDIQKTMVYGGELVSPILCGIDNEYQIQIESLCNLFKHETHQNLFDSNRASIHVHINVGDSIPLYALHNLVKLSLMYEPFLYKISGFGNNNRGVFNNFVFCRPMTSPPVYKYDSKYYHLYSSKTLLTSTTKRQFFDYLYNSAYCIDHTNKYVPQRYVGLNFYSILVRSSLEFRYANITTTPEYLMAWIKLCQYIVKTSFNRSSIDLDTVRTLNDTSIYSIEEFDSFLDFIQLSEPYRKILLNLFKESPDIKDISHILSHVDTYSFDPTDLKVTPINETLIKRVKPANYRDYLTEIEAVQKTLSKSHNEKTVEIKELTFFTEQKPVNNQFTTSVFENMQTSYQTYTATLNNESPNTTFYRVMGRRFGLNQSSDSLARLNHIKSQITNSNACFFYPIFHPGNVHSFTVPRRSDLPDFIKGKRITFSMETNEIVLFRYKNVSIEIRLSRHTESFGFYCYIRDVINNLATLYVERNPSEFEEETNV